MSVELDRERSDLADNIDRWLEWPMIILAAIWLVLLVLELVNGITPALERVGLIIWIIFIAEYVLRFVIAANKGVFLRRNWLTLISLVIPAIRVLRVLRIARVLRGVRLVRVIGSVNRAMNSLGRSMNRRGVQYVAASTLVVLFAGAAGMYAFERHVPGSPLQTFVDALWWTAMLLTTIASDYWPRTAEGRALTLFLSAYALAILGYVAAALASFFIGQEAADEASTSAEIATLRNEIAMLREDLARRPGDRGGIG